MATNETGNKSLDRIAADPRVRQCYRDSDGIWIEPERGFTFDPASAHGLRADTVKEALSLAKRLTACACHECVTGEREK